MPLFTAEFCARDRYCETGTPAEMSGNGEAAMRWSRDCIGNIKLVIGGSGVRVSSFSLAGPIHLVSRGTGIPSGITAGPNHPAGNSMAGMPSRDFHDPVARQRSDYTPIN